ncbi:MAG: hypothetical protein E6Q97_12350 [Desulfurellales bacterium]|nr:MAG: hypothetical protein E6Q97_12350 [Desulfurellales bacterium]
MAKHPLHDGKGPRSRVALAWAVLRGRTVMSNLTIEAHPNKVVIRANGPKPVAVRCTFRSRGLFIDDDAITLINHDPDDDVRFGIIDARTDHSK